MANECRKWVKEAAGYVWVGWLHRCLSRLISNREIKFAHTGISEGDGRVKNKNKKGPTWSYLEGKKMVINIYSIMYRTS